VIDDAGTASMDARTILWTDAEIYHRRYEKAARALIAVERALRANRPLRGEEDEFLDLYDDLAAASPEHFTQIWQDPYAYLWARLAYELVGSCLNPAPSPRHLEKYCAALGTSEPRAALVLHLGQFKRLVLALAMISGKDRRLRRPLDANCPLSIVGSKYSVIGHGRILIRGIIDGSLEVIHEGRSTRLSLGEVPLGSDGPRLVERPVARCGDYELLLKPETFHEHGIEGGEVLLEVPENFQERQVALVEDALRLVERHQPAAFEHFCDVILLTALKPPSLGTYSNVSYTDLPGAFILSAVQEPYWIADALVHEFHHNRFSFIEEQEPVLDFTGGDEPEEFYSPWRDDPRPVNGLLQAVYVYIPVCRFWFSIWQSGETSGDRRAYVEDQAVRAALDLKVGASQLRLHARFTDFGAGLFKEMEREIDSLNARLPVLGLSPGAPAMIARPDGQIVLGGRASDGKPLSVIDTIRSHARQFGIHGQCRDLESILGRS
jgi:HEXXH motif-containing protein